MLFVTLCLESQPGGRFNLTLVISIKWRLTTTPSLSNFKVASKKPPTNKVMLKKYI